MSDERRLSRAEYAAMYGPTTGDRVRLADTELFSFLGQRRQQNVLQDVVLALHRVVGQAGHLGQHFLGEHAVRPRAPGAGFQTVLQARHADLEELVHVGREDQQEIQTLHQRVMVVHGLLEHP